MAELLGAIASGVTLAALFKACIEAFDLIQTSRQQEVDFKKLKLRLNIEKCRLYIWGESMGLTDCVEADRDRPIDRFRFPELVREILEVVFQLFHDSHRIRDKYGCRQATSEDLLQDEDQNGPISSLATSFSNFSIRSSQFLRTSKIMQNIVWVIHDRKKFGALVAEIKDLVDSLQGVTSPSVPMARQAGTMRRKIVNIRDAETLSLIAEVCSEDHPDIADAASTKADTMSLASTHQRHVVAWTDGVQESQVEAEERMSPDLESLTVTELKHKILEMIQEKKERESSSLLPGTQAGRESRYENLGTGLPPIGAFSDSITLARTHSLMQKSHPYQDPNIPQLDASQGAAVYQQSWDDLTPSNNYTPQTQRAPTDNNGFPTTSSVSSYSASSNHDDAHYDGSASGSFYDPTDGSSVTSDMGYEPGGGRTLPRPSGLMNEYIPPEPQSMMGQFSSNSSSPAKKHKCRVCDKRFTRPSSLQTHTYSHTGEKPYVCTVEGCGRQFSVVSSLRRHRKVHKN